MIHFQRVLQEWDRRQKHYIYIYIYIYHHNQVTLPARISQTLFFHTSLSFIANCRSSKLQSCCRYVFAWRPALVRSYVGVRKRTSLMNSSLLLQQCTACLVCLTWMDLEMWGKWPYSCCFVGVLLPRSARSILVQFHLAFSLCVLSASRWCIHRAVLTQPLIGRNPVLFYPVD